MKFTYHTGWIGHLKSIRYKEIINKRPESLIIWGVWKELKSNKAREIYMKNLIVLIGPNTKYDFLPNFKINE